MTLRAGAIVGWTVLLLAVGCVSRGKLYIGRAFGPADAPPTAAGAAVAGAAGSGNAVLVADRAGGSSAALSYEPLNAHIQDIKGLTLAIVTVKCGDCADIVVVAGGGHGPYAFAWEDGSTNAQRHVCPAAGAELSVTATDTALHNAEFSYAGQSPS